MRTIALITALVACSSGDGGSSRIALTRAGQFVCSGVRVAPTVCLTAAHCGEQLSLDGHALRVTARYNADIEELECPAGSYTNVVGYLEEPIVTVDLQDGLHSAAVTAQGINFITVDRECYPGDSGSPVYTDRGVVAIVTRRAPGSCFAEFIQ